MSPLDWWVLGITLVAIVAYGIFRSKKTTTLKGYFLADQSLPWSQVGLSVMATQASAITFLSGPGQAYANGMRFIQFYLGLPLAVIVLCTSFIPIFHRLKVYTAYEYLENRFDVRTRVLTALLFLLLRAVSTAVSLYAPCILLSSLLSIPLPWIITGMAAVVVMYTTSGGSRAVSYTQFFQMLVIFSGMFLVGFITLHMIPHGANESSFGKALEVAGSTGRLQSIDYGFYLNRRYTLWSGLIGGFFLQLSYFGTDQSQVGRYLTGQSIHESRLGLILNGIIKIPMQFLILLLGVFIFTFYQFKEPPLFFNSHEMKNVQKGPFAKQMALLEQKHHALFIKKKENLTALLDEKRTKGETSQKRKMDFIAASADFDNINREVAGLVKKNNPEADTNDSNYVFLNFSLAYLPKGVIGLVIAIVFLASMGSIASALHAMSTCSMIDIYKRTLVKNESPAHYLFASRAFIIFWGLVCMGMAFYAAHLGNLLEAVNGLGSLFYGTILGIFLVAFFLKKVTARAVFYAAVISEIGILIVNQTHWVEYLWLNAFGSLSVIFISSLLNPFMKPATYPADSPRS